jgi:hypothetical protein
MQQVWRVTLVKSRRLSRCNSFSEHPESSGRPLVVTT